ncbi:tryptophan halogenase family protein [Thalassotalea sp. PS06]|uniref:tryptophan halogenase family protein n=1 Tax=Thalassotalea sp. PS06 TaxID=2594005 RepID=UPI001162129C|nr:tryptophan halogenase family protein [Thalassotalea sp. PS06]QDP02756.1 tryptophan 7-halogenase [Thalassotalea sp. PS06]
MQTNSTAQTQANPSASPFNIVILGGGSAGWMTAAALANTLPSNHFNIRLVESEQIGTVSVGEATIPGIHDFNRFLNINEQELIKATNATFKLGIEFEGWTKGSKYVHPFGPYGLNKNGVPFHQMWLKAKLAGEDVAELVKYNMEGMAAQKNKFSPKLNIPNFPIEHLNYAFHLDAVAYAKYLRQYAEQRGVERIEGKFEQARLNSDGFIQSLTLTDGREIPGDFFIDCSGFKALLIEKTLHACYEDWRHWLPCDSAVAIQSKSQPQINSYTKAITHENGWRWQIPLQNRMGNGLVYSSRFMSADEAVEKLQSLVKEELITEPNHLRWVNGCRPEPWRKNCLAIGLSAGFIEPLESTGLQLIQSAIFRLLSLFPDKNFNQSNIDTYNRFANAEIKSIRDFVILHYKQTDNDHSPFWNYCRNMDVPDSLKNKMEMYQQNGNLFRENNELFSELNWLSVLNGQGMLPKTTHPLTQQFSNQEIMSELQQIENAYSRIVDSLPSHDEFLAMLA